MKYLIFMFVGLTWGCSPDYSPNGEAISEVQSLEEAHFAGKSWCDVTTVTAGDSGSYKCEVNTRHTYTENFFGFYSVTVETLDSCYVKKFKNGQSYLDRILTSEVLNDELFTDANYSILLPSSHAGKITKEGEDESTPLKINYLENGFQYISEDDGEVLSEFTSCEGRPTPLLAKECTLQNFYKKGLAKDDLKNDVTYCQDFLTEVKMLEYYRKGIADSQ